MAAKETENNVPYTEQTKDMLDLIKGDGPWQRRIILVVYICAVPFATHDLVISFFAPNLDYWCAKPLDWSLSLKEWKLYGLPPDDPKCSRYKEPHIPHSQIHDVTSFSLSDTIACNSWEYDRSTYKSTILTEWDLVCDREWLISFSKAIFIAGHFVAVLAFGYISDRFGRRLTIAICNVIGVVSAITCAYSVSYPMFAASRFFIAVGVAGAYNTAFVLMMEIIGPERRSLYGIGFQTGWCFGYITLPFIAWLLKDWFWIHVVISLPSFFLLCSWWMLPESPRWLLSHGKYDEAEDILFKAGRKNGVDVFHLNSSLKLLLDNSKVEEKSQSSKTSCFWLFVPGLWQKTIVILYLWCAICFVYYGISFNTNEIPGDPFLNFALYGFVEVPANIIAYFAIHFLGRRFPMAISLAGAGVGCLLMYAVPEDPWWIQLCVSLFGKFNIACALSIVYVMTAEIFPTVVRNIGMGTASMMGRVGAFSAPFVRELGKATHPVVPQVVFGILGIIGSLLVLLLPETNHVTVPDTVEEATDVSRNHVFSEELKEKRKNSKIMKDA